MNFEDVETSFTQSTSNLPVLPSWDETSHSGQEPQNLVVVGVNEPPIIGPSLPIENSYSAHLMNGGESDDPEDPGHHNDHEDGTDLRYRERLDNRLGLNDASSVSSNISVPLENVLFPSLPEDELLRPPDHSASCMPPPEPEETRSYKWTENALSHSCANMIGPWLPDVPSNLSSNLPNNLRTRSSSEIYGPILPPGFFQEASSFQTSTNHIVRATEDESASTDIIGPIPPWEQENETIEKEYKERLIQYTAEKAEKNSELKREEWMLNPPQKFMSSKKFSRATDNGDRSEALHEWTKTPKDADKNKLKTSDDCLPGPSRISLPTNNFDSNSSSSFNDVSRGPSMLSLHRRKRKNEKPAESTETHNERRPFDRELDLDISRTQNLSKNGNEVFKRYCEGLNSRFAPSSKDP